jgi:hypothetical protein
MVAEQLIDFAEWALNENRVSLAAHLAATAVAAAKDIAYREATVVSMMEACRTYYWERLPGANEEVAKWWQTVAYIADQAGDIFARLPYRTKRVEEMAKRVKEEGEYARFAAKQYKQQARLGRAAR